MAFHSMFMAWPEGRLAALTTSWDDGTVHDRRLIELFNRHGIKGTFNLNAELLATEANPGAWYIARSEVVPLYAGHEIALHSAHHPYLEMLPTEGVVEEMIRDRVVLEELAGRPIKGMALPYGTYTPETLAQLKVCGVLHCRTTRATRALGLPGDFLEWHPTCHHKDPELPTFLERLVADIPHARRARLLYLWGHSYEFDRDNNWELIETFAAMAGPDQRIWHATNMEVMDYLLAWRALRWTVTGDVVENPSARPVWIMLPDGPRELPPNAALSLPDNKIRSV